MNQKTKKKIKVDLKSIDFDSLLNKDKVLRKAELNDIFGNTSSNQQLAKKESKEKIKKYRLQGEFGEKKFIKP